MSSRPQRVHPVDAWGAANHALPRTPLNLLKPIPFSHQLIASDYRDPYFISSSASLRFSNPDESLEDVRRASVTHVFRPAVKHEGLAVNPLRLAIIRFRSDQAFE
jgi:hypothetical protein